MKIKIRKSDIIAIIIILIVVLLIIKFVESGRKNREYLYKNGIETIGIIYKKSHLKSRRFVDYEYFIYGVKYTGGYDISEGDLPINIGDSIKILYDPKDYSNSTAFKDKEGKIVKIYKVSEEDLRKFIEQLPK